MKAVTYTAFIPPSTTWFLDWSSKHIHCPI